MAGWGQEVTPLLTEVRRKLGVAAEIRVINRIIVGLVGKMVGNAELDAQRSDAGVIHAFHKNEWVGIDALEGVAATLGRGMRVRTGAAAPGGFDAWLVAEIGANDQGTVSLSPGYSLSVADPMVEDFGGSNFAIPCVWGVAPETLRHVT